MSLRSSRLAVLVLVACVSVGVSPRRAAADPPRCRAALSKETAKLASAVAKARHQCAESVAAGALPATTDCATEAKASAAVAKATTKMRAGIAKACGGANRLCDAGDTGADADVALVAIGWDGGTCPGLVGAECAATVGDCGDVATCLACATVGGVAGVTDLVYGAFAAPAGPTAKAVRGCQQALGKETAKLLALRAKILDRCWSAVAKGKTGYAAPCPAGDASGGTAAALALAASKRDAKVCRACGGPDGACGGGDDLGVGAVGFAATCPDVTVPDGAACGASIGAIGDAVACTGCVADAVGRCLGALTAPWGGAYPAVCRPPAAAPTATADYGTTPTPAATPTVTATVAPTPTGHGATATPGAIATPLPRCLDGVIEAPEECERMILGGDAACPGRCRADCTCAPPCGDGLAAGGEPCDGVDLRGATCDALGFDGGTLGCLADCRGLDTRTCGIPDALPPDPATIAPELDLTVATDLATATAFLWNGEPRTQYGVAPDTIVPARAAVLVGRVLDAAGAPLGGVRVSIHEHPELGVTQSREDGRFMMAVNGGAPLRVRYAKPGHLEAQRQADVRWQAWTHLPDVVLLTPDPAVTTVAVPAGVMQVARGSVSTDDDGTRRATVLFPAGTAAELVMPDGTTQPLDTLHVRATEFTVGALGPQAMPAELPPTTGYTYAVELSVDEAIAAGAASVRFDRAVALYVENFLDFPTGANVPLGYFDRQRGEWVASPDGRVIAVLAVSDGSAVLDTDGDGFADDGSALGVTDEERATLATLYAAGTTLWRSPVTHFTPWDCNWSLVPPDDATEPEVPEAKPEEEEEKQDEQCEVGGSIIECQSQVLGERLPLVGTPYTLNYRSDRVPGRNRASTLTIPLIGSTYPASLLRVHLQVDVGGRRFERDFAPAPNLSHFFVWDGRDYYGRELQGAQRTSVRISYVYQGRYVATSSLSRSFSRFTIVGTFPGLSRGEVYATQEYVTTLGPWRYAHLGLGGWSLSAHHVYDSVARRLYEGSGKRRTAADANVWVIDMAPWWPEPSPEPAVQAIAVDADGSRFFADHATGTVYRSTNGVLSIVAGGNGWGTAGDGGPATAAQLTGPVDLAVGPDGSLYVLENDLGDVAATRFVRVRRVDPSGIITTVAGTGVGGFAGDGGPATAARFSDARGIAVGADGSLFVADTGNHRVRHVGPDGVVETLVGTGVPGYDGDGSLATPRRLDGPRDVAVGLDGSVWVADSGNYRIRRVLPGGRIRTMVGIGFPGGDDLVQRGVDATIGEVVSLVVTANGELVFADDSQERIRHLDAVGFLRTLAGVRPEIEQGPQQRRARPGQRALASEATPVLAVAAAPDGSTYLVNSEAAEWNWSGGDWTHVFHLREELPPFTGYGYEIVDHERGLLHVLGWNGRHTQTVQGLTNTPLLSFEYDVRGRLIGIRDGQNNTTVIERNGAGTPLAIVSPWGDRTALAIGPDGMLAGLTNPNGEAYAFDYEPGGLLKSLVTPRAYEHAFAYDALGRLVRDEDPSGGLQTLARTTLAAGHEVVRTTGLGRTSRYRRETRPENPEHDRPNLAYLLTNEAPDGSVRRTWVRRDGVREIQEPTGNSTLVAEWHDAVFDSRIQRSQASAKVVHTGAGEWSQIVSRTLELSSPYLWGDMTRLLETRVVNGRTFEDSYDFATRTFRTVSPAGRVDTGVIDGLGRMVRKQNGSFLPSERTYDGRGLLASIRRGSGPDERVTTYTYDAKGNLVATADRLGLVSTLTYDDARRVRSHTNAAGATVTYAYDESGNVSAMTPAERPAHEFTYTPTDELASYVPPAVAGSGPTTYTRDLDRHPLQVLRPDGTSLAFTHDARGRLERVTSAEGPIAYSYAEDRSQVESVTTPSGDALWLYYDNAEVRFTQWTGAVNGWVETEHDENLWPRYVGVNGFGFHVSRDEDGREVFVEDLFLARDPATGRVVETWHNGVVDEYAYNGFGEVVAHRARFEDTPLYEVVYTRDARGRITAATETIEGDTHELAYGYDGAGRLARVERDGIVIEYAWDGNGNRTGRTVNGVTTTATYDAQDRLLQRGSTSYGYDANGTLTSRTTGGQTDVLDHDAFGQLRTVSLADGPEISYVRDGMHRRIGRVVDGALDRGWLWLNQLQLAAELDAAQELKARYAYATRRNVPDLIITPDGTYRVIADARGSVRLVVQTTTGEVAQRIDYDEFGRVLLDTNPGFQPFGFAGGLYDPATGLVRFNAREYDPASGRFTAKDPLRFAGGDTNLYGYVLGDPVNFTDPEGLKTWECRRPLHGVPGQTGKRNGLPAWEGAGNPVYHEWLCVTDPRGGKPICGGQGPAGPMWGPGHEPGDQYSPEQCEEEEPDNECFEKCLIDKFKEPRPEYGPFGPGTSCQEWTDDLHDACADKCDLGLWTKLFN